MRDLTILMDLEVGRPASMLSQATEQGVQVYASCLFPRLGGRVAHAAVSSADVDKLKAIVTSEGGVVADERECVVVPNGHLGGPDAVSRALAQAGIVINVAYFGTSGQMVLSTVDVAGAKAALGLD